MKKLTIDDIRKLKPKESILIDKDGKKRLFIAEYKSRIIVHRENMISTWTESSWQNWTLKKEKKKVVYEAFESLDGELLNYLVGSYHWNDVTDHTDYKRVPKADITIEVEE